MPKKRKNKKPTRHGGLNALIKKTIEQVQGHGFFNDYEISFGILTKEKNSADSGHTLAASIDVDHRYSRAFMTVYLPMIHAYKNKCYKEIKSVICHELAHIATHKLYHYATERYPSETEIRDAWECATEHFGRLLYGTVYKK